MEAVQRVDVRTRVSGAVQAVHFREDSLVKQGDLLAKLSSADVKALVDQNRAAFEEAKVKLAELKAGSRKQEI